MKTFKQLTEQLTEAKVGKTPHEVMRQQLKFPKSNSKDYYAPKHGKWESGWSKSGGYAGHKMIDQLVDRAKKLGFKPHTDDSALSPDGYHSTNNTLFKHPGGHELEVSKHYGVTKHDNNFWAKLRWAPSKEMG